MRSILLTIVVAFIAIFRAMAQDAVPAEILERTLFIKAGSESGTAFAIEHNGKLYLVTAKHVVAGIENEQSRIQISRAGRWLDYHIVKTIFPPSGDADIAVLKTNKKLTKPFEIGLSDRAPAFGQQVWFLGYPWGIHTVGIRVFETHKIEVNAELLFIKRGTMSASDATHLDAVILYIDGFNNPGFSGGPILYWDFNERAYKIAGVVMGYRQDTAKLIVNGQHVDTQLLVNSGILIAYQIKPAIEAIEKDDAEAAK